MKTNTNILKAPFNFVPLNEKVYFPAWADRISQDIPFSDGLDGVIDVSIETLTPLFIRNGHSQEDALQAKSESANSKDSGNSSISGHPKRYKSFSNVGGKFMIPGTSLKGCIRKNLEIMSFGKMRLNDKIELLHNVCLNQGSPYMKSYHLRNIKSGRLKFFDNKWIIETSNKPIYRISQKEIESYFNTSVLSDNFRESPNDIFKKNANDKYYHSAKYKYSILENEGIDKHHLENLRFKISNSKNKTVKIDANGDIFGSIVLTGQPNTWKEKGNSGKKNEFVFDNKCNIRYTVEESIINKIFLLNSKSEDWKDYFPVNKNNSVFINTGLPIFFRIDSEDNVIDFGLTMLYKFLFSKKPIDCVPLEHKCIDKSDMSDCLFGRVDEQSYKGRVQFSNLYLLNNYEEENEIQLILSSPKPSYYPLYIKQNAENHITYDDGLIAGWKRYYVRKDIWKSETNSDNSDIPTIIKPIKKAKKFKGKITFHNLKPLELGALLSSLSFHGTSNTYHQLGQGKPYGFGKVQLSISANFDKPIDYYLGLFEHKMNYFLGSSYINNESIQSNIKLASDCIDNDWNKYMELSVDKNREDEFSEGKEKKKKIVPVSNINTNSIISVLKNLEQNDICNINDYLLNQSKVDSKLELFRKIENEKRKIEKKLNVNKSHEEEVELRKSLLFIIHNQEANTDLYKNEIVHSYIRQYSNSFDVIKKAIDFPTESLLEQALNNIDELGERFKLNDNLDMKNMLQSYRDKCTISLRNIHESMSINKIYQIDELQDAVNYILDLMDKKQIESFSEEDEIIIITRFKKLYSRIQDKKKWKKISLKPWKKIGKIFRGNIEDIFNQITQKK